MYVFIYFIADIVADGSEAVRKESIWRVSLKICRCPWEYFQILGTG